MKIQIQSGLHAYLDLRKASLFKRLYESRCNTLVGTAIKSLFIFQYKYHIAKFYILIVASISIFLTVLLILEKKYGEYNSHVLVFVDYISTIAFFSKFILILIEMCNVSEILWGDANINWEKKLYDIPGLYQVASFSLELLIVYLVGCLSFPNKNYPFLYVICIFVLIQAFISSFILVFSLAISVSSILKLVTIILIEIGIYIILIRLLSIIFHILCIFLQFIIVKIHLFVLKYQFNMV